MDDIFVKEAAAEKVEYKGNTVNINYSYVLDPLYISIMADK